MIFPALSSALLDRRLRRQDLLVYGAALQALDMVEFRSWKQIVAARATGMRDPHVSRSIRRLHALGYLERDDRDPPPGPGRPRSYRLRYSRMGPPGVTIRAA